MPPRATRRLAHAQTRRLSEGRGRDRVLAATANSTTMTTACGRTRRRDARQTEAGVRAAVGPGHRRQFLADHRRRVLGDPRLRRGREEARPDAEGRHRRQPVVGARSLASWGSARCCRRPQLLKRNELTLQDVETWELNEAFADAGARLPRRLEGRQILPRDARARRRGRRDRPRQNSMSMAARSALGHPVGTCGNRIVLHLVNAMKRLGTRRGIATECIGGGLGGAMLIETV